MKLTKVHIGKFVNIAPDDDWFYTLIDVRKGRPLFRTQSGEYLFESRIHDDWRIYSPARVSSAETRLAWKVAKDIDGESR